jgi:phosphopantetheinyl transferase (holo-ACP synthase)
MKSFVFKTGQTTVHLIHPEPPEAEKWMNKYGKNPLYASFFTGKSPKYKLQQAVKLELLEQLGLTSLLKYQPDGKPLLKDGRHISISHSGYQVAVALSETIPIGLDIQLPVDKVMRLTDKFATEQEKRTTDNPEKAVFLWAAKEAVYKAAGYQGLPFKQIHIERQDGLPVFAGFRWKQREHFFRLTSKKINGLIMVLAEKHPDSYSVNSPRND